MKKILDFIENKFLFILTLFLLAFIPLYPKFPLLDIKNTWVYIRLEDFVVLFTLFFWLALLFRKKVSFRTPLTIPILIFWVIGAIATTHGVLLLFPNLANVFPNVAFLSFLRHLEYMSLFFVAFSSVKNKNSINSISLVLTATLFLVFLYGIGQKYFSFPAYLTMNEEFAKGIAIQLSSLSRVPSTFAGHYDLAAYLVLIIPIVVSLIFGFRNWLIKILLAALSIMGLALLFMTVSRVSIVVLAVALLALLLLQRKKIFIYVLPLFALAGIIFFALQPSLLARFGNTIREVDVLVDSKTGDAIGQVKFVDSSYVKDKLIKQTRVIDKQQVDQALTGDIQELEIIEEEATISAQKPLKLPKEIALVKATNVSTGENLPQGTGYVNLALSPVVKRLGNFFYEVRPDNASTTSAQIIILHGDFLVKRASAYDLSFTTRFQGEWPHAINSFERNVFLGSGYGSVSLAVDNNYFRMLAETGLFGLASFFVIFLVGGIYIARTIPNVESVKIRSFVLGFSAGVFGLFLNAILIDVFEASKIAFVLWLLFGITLGLLSLYRTREIHIYEEVKKAFLSPLAFTFYFAILVLGFFSSMLNNYFVGDDFTWLRWVADCGAQQCEPILARVGRFFTEADGFFYRPGAKIYFSLMYSTVWLNQVIYHAISISLHFIVVVIFFLLARRVLKDTVFAAIASVLFLVMSGYHEAVFWISATGYVFNAFFALLAILFFSYWEEKRKRIYLILSFLSIVLGMLFHEVGIVIPLLIILFSLTKKENLNINKILGKFEYIFILVPIPIYLVIRFIADSHWSGGDYSYNLLRFPLNFVGNTIGYILLILTGPTAIPIYDSLRNVARENIFLSFTGVLLLLIVGAFLVKVFRKRVGGEDRKIIYFGLLFFIISLLPFLGLGNIASRYSYLASLGIALLLAFLIKKFYLYLNLYGKDIAFMTISVIFLLFTLFHIIQLQQTHQDWSIAGDKTKKFFVSIDEAYSNLWKEKTVNLRFVDTPIRNGNAWVFPVGLEDALWFAFKSDKITVYTEPSLNIALKNAGDSLSDIVFRFNDDGSVAEVLRLKGGIPINILRETQIDN